MKIAMVGSGYVGLVSGACFADVGHDVVCIDKDEAKIERLRNGVMPIYEPGLAELVETNVQAGRLSFTTSLSEGIDGADAVFIAVGTPSRAEDGHADLSFVYAVAEEIGQSLKHDVVVVNKSTVPVGTGDEVARIIERTGCTHCVSVVSNPEFLREGAAIDDFANPDRIVVGSEGDFGREVMERIYAPLTQRGAPIVFTSRRSSELIKYAANAFLAIKVTFINEIADLCEQVNADINDVAEGVGLDNRIGPKFLRAGPGYGGSCFPKDTVALLRTSELYESRTRIVEAVVDINDTRKLAMGRRILKALGGFEEARGKYVALLGLTFKPNTDDMRASPAIDIARVLNDAGVKVGAYDPEGMEQARPLMPYVTMKDSAYSAIEGADAVVIVTEWDEFRALDLDKMKQLANAPVLIDLRNIYRPEDMRAKGFAYSSIGRA